VLRVLYVLHALQWCDVTRLKQLIVVCAADSLCSAPIVDVSSNRLMEDPNTPFGDKLKVQSHYLDKAILTVQSAPCIYSTGCRYSATSLDQITAFTA
jgi:hypothetical protein